MQIPPKYTITPEMIELIAKIESYRMNFASLEIPSQIKENIQRKSLLKSSLYSARIEGNPLELSEVSFEKSKEINKLEIFNIIKASKFIENNIKIGNVTKEMLLKLHELVLKNLNPDAGFFRKEQSAIFNEAGVAVYMPPSPFAISKFIDELLAYINEDIEKFPLIKAFAAHLVFEKIHPFLDGNGRVGRLLISLILKAKGWDFTFAIPFEEYLDDNRPEYYFHLDQGLKNTDEYLFFMLEAFLSEIEKIREDIKTESDKKESVFLPPRQEEILNIIKEQKIVSFDMIRRRFLKVPERTLRYDLKKLLDKNLIERSGETKGSYYRAKST
jgi:Fic family protein